MVLKKDYAQVKSRKPNSKLFASPYTLLLVGIVNALADFASDQSRSLPVVEKLNFVFDHQPGQEARIVSVWPYVRDQATENIKRLLQISPPDFASDDDVVALQAAHIVAWGMRRFVDDISKDPYGAQPRFGIFDNKVLGIRWTPEELAKF